MCVCVGKDFNLLLDNPSSLCVKVENLYTCKLTSSLGHTPRALFTSEAHPVHTTAVRQPTQKWFSPATLMVRGCVWETMRLKRLCPLQKQCCNTVQTKPFSRKT